MGIHRDFGLRILRELKQEEKHYTSPNEILRRLALRNKIHFGIEFNAWEKNFRGEILLQPFQIKIRVQLFNTPAKKIIHILF